jgi:hypothetical protein
MRVSSQASESTYVAQPPRDGGRLELEVTASTVEPQMADACNLSRINKTQMRRHHASARPTRGREWGNRGRRWAKTPINLALSNPSVSARKSKKYLKLLHFLDVGLRYPSQNPSAKIGPYPSLIRRSGRLSAGLKVPSNARGGAAVTPVICGLATTVVGPWQLRLCARALGAAGLRQR